MLFLPPNQQCQSTEGIQLNYHCSINSIVSRPTSPFNPFSSCASDLAFADHCAKKGKGSPYSNTESMVLELIPVLCSQPAGDVSHKPSSRLPLLSARPAVTLTSLEGCYQFRCLVNRGTTGVNSLPKTVTRQCRGYDLNTGPSVPESSTLTTRLASHHCARL